MTTKEQLARWTKPTGKWLAKVTFEQVVYPAIVVVFLGWIGLGLHSFYTELTNILHTSPLGWHIIDSMFVGTLLLTLFVSLGFTFYLFTRRKPPSEQSARRDNSKNLLAIVPDQRGNYWEKVVKDDIVYLLLRGYLRVTNTSTRRRTLIPKSGIVGYDSVGFHMVPQSGTNFWGHDYFIEKRSSVSLQFNYQIKDFRQKTNNKMFFDLFFIDHLANEYQVKLEFREFIPPTPPPKTN